MISKALLTRSTRTLFCYNSRDSILHSILLSILYRSNASLQFFQYFYSKPSVRRVFFEPEAPLPTLGGIAFPSLDDDDGGGGPMFLN